MLRKIAICAPFWSYGFVISIQQIFGLVIPFQLAAPLCLILMCVPIMGLIARQISRVEFILYALLPPVIIAMIGGVIGEIVR